MYPCVVRSAIVLAQCCVSRELQLLACLPWFRGFVAKRRKTQRRAHTRVSLRVKFSFFLSDVKLQTSQKYETTLKLVVKRVSVCVFICKLAVPVYPTSSGQSVVYTCAQESLNSNQVFSIKCTKRSLGAIIGKNKTSLHPETHICIWTLTSY